jgi:type IV pilus assembly protein PilC
MSSYCYEAVDAGGLKTAGTLDVADQTEALRRVKEMGLFPTKIAAARRRRQLLGQTDRTKPLFARKPLTLSIPIRRRKVKTAVLAVFTRQLATLIEAGMPLLRGLHLLEEQEEHPALKRIIGELARSIEGGSSLSESLSAFPKIFSPLFVNMVRAGELGGALEITLTRLAEFMEKAQKIKGKVKAAMFYPSAVLCVAVAVLSLMMIFVVPRFQEVFQGLLEGRPMPAFTVLVFNISLLLKNHFLMAAIAVCAAGVAFKYVIRTQRGRWIWDRAKLKMPIMGPVFRKLAISRFTRTLGTLLHSGVPILQALTIVKDTVGNVIVARAVSNVHESVKEGETIAVPLRASGVFPAIVAGMVDVGEQTGALPDMLMKVADNYDEQVDNSVSAMTSLLEPILIVLLAIIVGGIVIAMFLPFIVFCGGDFGPRTDN